MNHLLILNDAVTEAELICALLLEQFDTALCGGGLSVGREACVLGFFEILFVISWSAPMARESITGSSE